MKIFFFRDQCEISHDNSEDSADVPENTTVAEVVDSANVAEVVKTVEAGAVARFAENPGVAEIGDIPGNAEAEVTENTEFSEDTMVELEISLLSEFPDDPVSLEAEGFNNIIKEIFTEERVEEEAKKASNQSA